MGQAREYLEVLGYQRIQVKNSVGEDRREGVYVTSTNEEDIANSKGTCNFQIKWDRDAKTTAYLTVKESVKGVTSRHIPGVVLIATLPLR
jgi:hypothetical protein